jgi:hypothetical protein
MSEWFTVEEDDVSLSLDGKTINVLFASNDWGNQYIEIPVEFIKAVLNAAKKQTNPIPKAPG